jgi:hypothetical protein
MKSKPIYLFMILLLLTSLACNLTSGLNDGQAQAAVATAAVVGEQAQQAAATAAVVAATVAAQGQDVIATVQASDFEVPDVQALREKVAALMPDENGNISFTIGDAELTQIIQTQQAAAAPAGDAPQVQNLTVQFTNGTILLSGNVTEPIQAQLTISFWPVIEDGLLRFQVASATMGSIVVPPVLLQTVEASLNNTLGDALSNLPASVTLQTITVSEGSLTIMAHQG